MGVEAFITDLDGLWEGRSPLRLKIIGSTALFLQVDYDRGTKDSDVWETSEITPAVKAPLLALAGQDSALHKKHRIYLDIVSNGIPFFPRSPLFHAPPSLNKPLKHFHLEVLDVADVLVSKLKRFSANDVEDISAMIRKGRVDHRTFVRRFRSAVESAMDVSASAMSRAIKNFHSIERDHFRTKETKIDLPDYLD